MRKRTSTHLHPQIRGSTIRRYICQELKKHCPHAVLRGIKDHGQAVEIKIAARGVLGKYCTVALEVPRGTPNTARREWRRACKAAARQLHDEILQAQAGGTTKGALS